MKKFTKMSLAAAVAVAGFSTNAVAGQNFAEFAKNTTLNGYVRYRLNRDTETEKTMKTGDKETADDWTEEAKVVMKLTNKVNDKIKANLKFVSFAATKDGDGVAPTKVVEGNFVIDANGKATIIAGLQTSQSPFFANNGDTRSHGVTALIPAGPVTVAAAYYTTTVGGGLTKLNVAGGSAFTNNVTAAGIIAPKIANVVDIEGWYATVQNSADVKDTTTLAYDDGNGNGLADASATSVKVAAKVGPVNVCAMKTNVNFKTEALATGVKSESYTTGVTKVVASGKFNIVNAAVGYAMSEEDGGMVALDKDDDAKSDLSMVLLHMGATTDATATYASVNADVMKNLNIGVSVLSGAG